MKLLFLGISLLGIVSSASAVVIVKDHQPTATIVVDQNADTQIKNAAKTLQTYIQKSTGATLPVSNTPGKSNNINIGETDFTKQHHLNPGNLDQDGFILQGADAKNFAIIGGSDWGTEFGVDDFLERYLDVRWLMPTEIGIDIPKHPTLDIPPTLVRQEPVYLSRQLSPMNDLDANNPEAQWARFNRARGRIAFHHNMLHLFPVSIFGKTHPEFYPIVDGKRYIPKSDSDVPWQPNLSAPGIVDAAVEQIEKYFQEHPEATSYSLGMNDSNLWDESPASKARRSGKKNYLGLEDISDDYFTWANAVVAKVLLKYPDKWFGTLAYNGLAEPPTKVKVNPRIVPFITYERMRWEDPKLREAGQQLTERWEKVSPVLGWYDYAYGISYLLPRVYFHRMQKYLSWGASHNVKFHYAELYPNWGTGPKAWVYTKLLWNPNQDVDVLLDDWYTHFAGNKAAPKLKAYYAIWEKFWTVNLYQSKWNWDVGQYLPFNQIPSYLADVPQSYVTQSDQLMHEALQLADTPERKARVEKLNEMWQFYKASIVAYQKANAGMADPQNESEAVTFLNNATDVMAQSHKRQELLTAFKKDPLFAGSANWITRIAATSGENWGYSLLWRLLPWVEKSPQIKTQMTQIANGTDAVAAKQAQWILKVAAGNPTLASANPSFEDGTKGWDIWDKSTESSDYQKGNFTVSTMKAQSGTHSLLVKGLGRGALMQSIPYVAGSYFATVHCYIPQNAKAGTISLQLTAPGTILPSSNIPLQPGQWTSFTLPFTLPATKAENAQVRLMLLMDGFAPDSEIYIDDAGIYKAE
jgi:hypothetical protein